MSIFRNDTLGSWTRGGQAIVHNVRMTTQVFCQTVLAALVLWVGGVIWYALECTSEYQRFVLMKIAQASLMRETIPGNASPILFRTPSGLEYYTTPHLLLQSGLAMHTLEAFEDFLLEGAALCGAGALLVMFWAWFYFARTGKGLGSNEFLRGARFATRNQLRRVLSRHAAGSFEIGGVRIPDSFEPEHILICGAPGTGKTNIIIKMLGGIRARRRRAIVYDTAGTFVEKFYRPGIDLMLNPLDARGARWSPWVDVPKENHYDQIAASVISDRAGDPFWARSARGTLVAVLRKLVSQNRMLISTLLDTLLRTRLKDLAAFVEGTEASAFISTEGDRTSAGIQAELASVMRSFSYLDDTFDAISIRDWVENETDDSWLFITVKADQLPSLRPLITVWLDIAISAIMSLSPDSSRRLYCVIDELPTLQKLPSLSDFLARARKYGGCGILGFQSYPQLEATYGQQDAAAITGYCSTWVALRANDSPTARLISENLGQVEQIEANEGMSYGVNDMRDGVNLSRMQVTRPLVLPTEVTNLPNLAGFLRFGRDLPVVRFADTYNGFPDVAAGFEEREGAPVRLDPVAPQSLPPALPPRPSRNPQVRRDRKQTTALQSELPLDTDMPNPTAGNPDRKIPACTGERVEPNADGMRVELLGPNGNTRLSQHARPEGMRRKARPA